MKKGTLTINEEDLKASWLDCDNDIVIQFTESNFTIKINRKVTDFLAQLIQKK